MLRFLALFLPIKRLVWVQFPSGKFVLRRLHRSIGDEGDTFYRVAGHRPFSIVTIGFQYTFMGNLNTKTLREWGEYRPWWNPWPPEISPRLLEINIRAKKEPPDGRLRKTRTLSQVWEQG